MSYSNKPSGNLESWQRESLERDTHDRNAINHWYQAIKGNEKIMAELGLFEEIKACQRALIGLQMGPINFMPCITQQCCVIDYLPESLRHVAQYLSTKTRFDYLTCTMAVVMTIATALCGRFRINLEPTWNEAVLLYWMVIAESGEKKDSLINLLRQPLDEMMNELQAVYDNSAPQKQLKHKVRKAAFESRLHADIKRISKACYSPEHGRSDYDKLMEEADKLCEQAGVAREELNSKTPMARPNLFFSDISEKGLISALTTQGGYQVMMEQEAGLIDKIVTLGARFNIDLVLKAYNQKDHIVHNARSQIHVIKPSLNLWCNAQPVLASKFLWKNAAKGRGLASRFMFSFPFTSRIPSFVGDYSRQFQFFCDKVRSILKYNFTQDSHREIQTLKVTPWGHARLKEFQGQNLALIEAGYGHMAACLKKLHGIACRVAGVLHLWQCFASGTISEVISDQEIEAGIAIAHALIPHADHAFSFAGLIAVDPATRILRWIKDAHMTNFDYSTVKSAIDSKLNGELINAGLQRLISCNILGKVHDHKGLPVYAVNPQLCGWFTQPSIVSPITPPTTRSTALPAPSSEGLF